jgi:hypothetical protein
MHRNTGGYIMDIINVFEGLIMFITACSILFVAAGIFKKKEKFLPTVARHWPWPCETTTKGVYLAIRFREYDHGECFCEIQRIPDSSLLPSRMATKEDYQQVARTVLFDKEAS